MTFYVKAIKPPGLKTDKVRLEILNALRKEGRLQKKMLAGTAKYWSGAKPIFSFEIGLAGNDAVLLVGPSGGGAQLWVWLDQGTRPHIIRPRSGGVLRFRVGGRAGSTPGTLAVSRGSRGTQWISAKVVHHPGITARDWSLVVLKERQNPFFRSLNEAVARGYEKASR